MSAGPPEVGPAPDNRPEAPIGAGLVALAVARPVAVTVGVFLVFLFGWLSLFRLPIQLTPDIELPTLTVSTAWPGAAPAEVEAEIVDEQEEVLKNVDGVERMTSESSDGAGSVTLEFAVGADIDQALVRVNNRLSQVERYPESAREPVVSTADDAGPPLAVALVQRAEGAPDDSVAAFRTWAIDELVPVFERIPGVAKVDLFGGRDEEIEVRFDPTSLAARGVPLGQLVGALQGELRDVSGGDLALGKRRYLVRTPVRPVALSDLEQLVLRIDDQNRPVRLGDVASVDVGLRKYSNKVRGNGRESLAMLFRREAGSNVLEVTDAVIAAIEKAQQDQLGPLGLELNLVNDQRSYIRGALLLVQQNIVVGGLLAVAVLLWFLRDLRASLLIAVSIPISVMATALGMSLLGRTVNVVSLAGMAFAVGMVVDNSIVVLENIDTWRRKPGITARQAAVAGASEVWGALLAGTLTTVVVFVPIVFWQDEVGELLRDVAIAISLSVLSSLVVSVLVIPSYAARFLPTPTVVGPAEPAALAGPGGRAGAAIGRQAASLARSPWRAFGLTLLVTGSSVLVAMTLLPPMEYLPTGNRNFLFGVLIPPPGYSMAEMDRVGAYVQDRIVPYVAPAGSPDIDGVPPIGRTFFVARPNQAFMGASAADDDRIGDVVAYIQRVQRELPGFYGFASQASLFGRNIGSARSVDLEISGGDLPGLVALGGRLMGAIKGALPDAQVRPLPSLDLGSPELRVMPRREQAAALGLSPVDIGVAVDALVDGRIIGELSRKGEPRVDVVLRADAQRSGVAPGDPFTGEAAGPRTPAELAASPIATPTGQVVPLSAVADLSETVGPAIIRHIERRRAITLQVSPGDSTALETAVDVLRRQVIDPIVASGDVPDGVRLSLAGSASKLEVAQGRFAEVLLLAVLVCFLLMAALFEDFVAPLVILVTIPMAAAGGVVGLRLVDALLGSQPLDTMTAVGFVILIGVVVNNAILVVDGALARLREGDALDVAVGGAVARRVRPILMTTATSLAGLLPLVLFPGSGSELYRGVGAIVLGGLALSTALSLVVVPALFSLVWRVRLRGAA